jgi:hypothetical protein
MKALQEAAKKVCTVKPSIANGGRSELITGNEDVSNYQSVVSFFELAIFL